jgi:hypothetical protein
VCSSDLNLATPPCVSRGDVMAPGLQALNGRFPPNAPIPGRGLPHPEILQIPTRQIRLVRAFGAFVMSLVAAATLALGPAAVIAKIGAGAPVVVALSAFAPPVIPPAIGAAGLHLDRWLLHRTRNDVRARSTVVVAGATGSPRGRDDAVAMPCRAPGLGNAAAACLASRELQMRRVASEVLALSRRPRPPPAPGVETPYRFAALIAFDPASSPPHRWRRPVFLSSRV